jgi:hypothetical protein
MTTALLSHRYDPQPEPRGTDEQAEPSTSAVRGGASLENPPEITCLIRETLMLPFPVPCALPG